MNRTAELLRHDLAGARRSTLWWSLGIAALALVNVAFWPSLEGSDAMAAFDDMGSLLEAFGAEDLTSPAGYLDGQLFALMLPMLLIGMSIAHVSGRTAGDEDAGRLEVLLTLPVPRSSVWLSRWLTELASLTVAAGATALLLILTRSLFSLEEVGAGAVLGATLGSMALGALGGGLAYALAAFGASRARSGAVAAAALIASYLLAYVVPLNEDLAGARRWSPWHWALSEQPVSRGVDGLPLAGVWLLVGGLVALGTLGVTRRDVRTP